MNPIETLSPRASRERHARDLVRLGVRTGLYSGVLPPEFDLVKRVDCSRNALRAALQHLVSEGVLSRARSLGTQVVAHRWSPDVWTIRDADEISRENAARSRYSIVEALETVASTPIAAALEIEPGDPVILLERVAFVDEEPVCLITVWLPAALTDGLLELELDRDYYELLADGLGLTIHEGDVVLDAVSAAGAAELLNTDEQTPLLYSERVTTLDDGRPVALVCSRTRPDCMVMSTTRFRLPPSRGAEVEAVPA